MNQKEIPATVSATRRPVFKIKLFSMQVLMLAIVVFLMAGSDLARWRELSEIHVSARGMTLVKAVEPHVVRSPDKGPVNGYLVPFRGGIRTFEDPAKKPGNTCNNRRGNKNPD